MLFNSFHPKCNRNNGYFKINRFGTKTNPEHGFQVHPSATKFIVKGNGMGEAGLKPIKQRLESLDLQSTS